MRCRLIASMADIATILVEGKSIQHKLTAAEGLTSDMIQKLVAADPVLVGDAGPVPAEGALLPETYLFTRGTSRAEIIDRMEKAEKKFLDAQWAARADRPALDDAGPGGDPGLHRGKGNRRCRTSAAISPRSSSTGSRRA